MSSLCSSMYTSVDNAACCCTSSAVLGSLLLHYGCTWCGCCNRSLLLHYCCTWWCCCCARRVLLHLVLLLFIDMPTISPVAPMKCWTKVEASRPPKPCAANAHQIQGNDSILLPKQSGSRPKRRTLYYTKY